MVAQNRRSRWCRALMRLAAVSLIVCLAFVVLFTLQKVRPQFAWPEWLMPACTWALRITGLTSFSAMVLAMLVGSVTATPSD